jgi:hypothetical protein
MLRLSCTSITSCVIYHHHEFYHYDTFVNFLYIFLDSQICGSSSINDFVYREHGPIMHFEESFLYLKLFEPAVFLSLPSAQSSVFLPVEGFGEKSM